jgi:hypothetical protein
LRFLRLALGAFAEEIGVPLPDARVRAPAASSVILVPPERAELLEASFASARDKLPLLDLQARNGDELGHGLHAQLVAAPQKYQVQLLAGGGEGATLKQLRRWCARQGITARTTRLQTRQRTASRDLELASLALAWIEAMCVARAIDWCQRPLPSAADTLRDP